MADRRDVTSTNLEVLLAEVQSLVLDGWVISPAEGERGQTLSFGQAFVVVMVRDDDTVASLKERAEATLGRPKLTPAERMQKARDARGKGKLDTSALVEE